MINDDSKSLPDESRVDDIKNYKGQPLWVEDICLLLGRLFSFIAFILVIFWAHGSSSSKGYLGGLDWNSHVFSFHPVMMIGAFLFTGLSITSYRIKSLSFKYKKYLHLISHILAKICLTIGLRAVYESKRDSTPSYHIVSLHSWLGILTTILLLQNDFFGALTYLFPFLSQNIQKIYRPYHIFFGKIAFVFLVITIETGVMEENTGLSCNPTTNHVDNDYGSHYNEISSGCRISSGLGIVTALALLFLIFALRNKRLSALSDYVPSDVVLSSYPFDRNTITSAQGSVMRTSLIDAFNLTSFNSSRSSTSSMPQTPSSPLPPPLPSSSSSSIPVTQVNSPLSQQSSLSKRTISA